MVNEICEPGTRANVAAWVEYAKSLSWEGQQDHIFSCKVTAQNGCPSIKCPLCNAIMKLRGSNRQQRRWCERTAYGKHNASRKELESFARADEIENRAIEAHAARLCGNAIAADCIDELVAWVIAEVGGSEEYQEEARQSYTAMVEECEEEFSGIIASILRSKMQHNSENTAYTPLSFTRYSKAAAENGHSAESPTLNRLLLFMAVMFCLLLASRTRYDTYRPPFGTLIQPAKSNTRLVVSLACAPRAPQPCPYSGNIPAVVSLAR